MRAVTEAGRPPVGSLRILVCDQEHHTLGEMWLEDFLKKFPEALVVAGAAASGVVPARRRIEEIIATAGDTSTPAELRRGTTCGVVLLDMALRAVFHYAGRRPPPATADERETIDCATEDQE